MNVTDFRYSNQTHQHSNHFNSKSDTSHSSSSSSITNKGNKRKATRVQRACVNCRKRKQGCEHERPCRRCVEKGINCTEVETKRKRGRVKPFGNRRNGSNHHDEEEDDLNEESESNDFEETHSSSEDTLSSEEDQSMSISPRGSSSSVIPHVFKLNVPSSNSDPQREQGSDSVLSGKARPNSPLTLHLDSNADGYHVPIRPKRGLSLALLLPFIGNLNSNEEQNTPVPMFIDDDDYLRESLELSSPSSVANDITPELNETIMPTSGDTTNLQQKIVNSNTPFFTPAFASRKFPALCSIEDGDTRSQMYIKECWEEYQRKSKTRNVDDDLQRVNEKWKEVMKCLRNLDWLKAQTLMEEMESNSSVTSNNNNSTITNDSFGEYCQPSILFWSSGGRIHYANEAFCNLVGYSVDELKYDVSLDSSSSFTPSSSTNNFYGINSNRDKMRVHSFFHPEEMMKILKRQLEAVQHLDKSSYQMNTRLLSKFKQEIPVSCSILNLRDTLGVSLLTVAIFV